MTIPFFSAGSKFSKIDPVNRDRASKCCFVDKFLSFVEENVLMSLIVRIGPVIVTGRPK